MKKKYQSPDLEKIKFSTESILDESDGKIELPDHDWVNYGLRKIDVFSEDV